MYYAWVFHIEINAVILLIVSRRFGGLQPFFKAVDTNGDNTLDFDEFTRAIAALNLEHVFPRSMQRRVFLHVDADQSGAVDLREMQVCL